MTQPDGKNPDLRVSDAERDAVVTELAQHFEDGRLDRTEFDERVSSSLAARTQRDLGELLTDLPQPVTAGHASGSQAARTADQAAVVRAGQVPGYPAPAGRPRALALLPLVLIAVVIGSVVSGGSQHGNPDGWPFAPLGFLWLLIPVIAIRIWIRRSRSRQWR